MSKASDRDPTFMQFMDDGSPKIVCEHCASWFAVSLPIDVTAYAKMIQAFARAHRRCAVDAQKSALLLGKLTKVEDAEPHRPLP